MKAIILATVAELLLALDGAAPHDILKAEPTLAAEHGTIVLSVMRFQASHLEADDPEWRMGS